MDWTHTTAEESHSGIEQWNTDLCKILYRPAWCRDKPFRLVAFVDDPPGARWTECDGGYFRDFATLAEAQQAAESLS